MNNLITALTSQADVALIDWSERWDIFSQTPLSELYEETVDSKCQFYVAFAHDEYQNFLIAQASAIAKWHLNFGGNFLPTNRQEMKNLAIYRYDQTSNLFKFFCDRITLATKPFFACVIACHDPHLSNEERLRVYKILANCYFFGEGGAPESKETAHEFAQKYNELLPIANGASL